jgi:hypothetical protein
MMPILMIMIDTRHDIAQAALPMCGVGALAAPAGSSAGVPANRHHSAMSSDNEQFCDQHQNPACPPLAHPQAGLKMGKHFPHRGRRHHADGHIVRLSGFARGCHHFLNWLRAHFGFGLVY